MINNQNFHSALFPWCVVLFANASAMCAAEAEPNKKAEAEAIRRFPEMGNEGSVFRQTYLERIAKYKRETPTRLEQPGWQAAIAEEVAASLTTNARDALKITRERVPGEPPNGGGESFVIKVRNLGSSRAVEADLKITHADQSESVEKKRIPPASEVTYPFGTEGKTASAVQIASARFPEKPVLPEPPKKEPTQMDEARVKGDIATMRTLLTMYRGGAGNYPSTSQGLKALVTRPDGEPRPATWRKVTDKVPIDPFGSEYVYIWPGQKNPVGYDLFSAGKDHQPGTDDDIWPD
jgi:type II secretion system protein G